MLAFIFKFRLILLLTIGPSALLLMSPINLLAQQIEFTGVIKSGIDSSRLPFCSVEVHNDFGKIIAGAQTDFDGRFSFEIDSSLLRSSTVLFRNYCFQTVKIAMEMFQLDYQTESTFFLSPICSTQKVYDCPKSDIRCEVIPVYYYFTWERPTRYSRKEARHGKLLLRKVEDGSKSCCPASRFCKAHNIEF